MKMNATTLAIFAAIGIGGYFLLKGRGGGMMQPALAGPSAASIAADSAARIAEANARAAEAAAAAAAASQPDIVGTVMGGIGSILGGIGTFF